MDYVTLLFRVVITNQKCKTITRKIQWKDEQATGFIKEKTPLTSSVFVMQTLCRRSFFNENLATVLGYDWEEWTPIELKEWKEVGKVESLCNRESPILLQQHWQKWKPYRPLQLNFKKLRQPLKENLP